MTKHLGVDRGRPRFTEEEKWKKGQAIVTVVEPTLHTKSYQMVLGNVWDVATMLAPSVIVLPKIHKDSNPA